MTDIVDGIARIQREFRAAGLKPPTAIILSTHEEGQRLLCGVSQTRMRISGVDPMGVPIEMADGSVYMEVVVLGVAVRWPANRKAMPDGSWRFE